MLQILHKQQLKHPKLQQLKILLLKDKKEMENNKKGDTEVTEETKVQEVNTTETEMPMDNKDHTKKLSNLNMIMNKGKLPKEINLLHHLHHYLQSQKQDNLKDNKLENLSKMDLLSLENQK